MDMLNFEAYEEAIKEIGVYSFAMKDGKVKNCGKIPCRECDFHTEDCGFKKTHWLYKEYQKPKIKISLATKVILENFDDKWKWIAKDKCGALWIFENKPPKFNEVWGLGISSSMVGNLKKDLFNFLSWEDEEPTNIKELLENCEVIDDE